MIPSALMMVRPAHFGYNPENVDNTFSQNQQIPSDVLALAQREFDAVAVTLEQLGLRLVLLDDTSHSPDAVFPNNWVSMHPDGTVMFYPMKAPSRRSELRRDLPELLADEGFHVERLIDWSALAEAGHYLEGTGSLVLDHAHKKAYAALSERTHLHLLRRWCGLSGYTAVSFSPLALPGRDGREYPIYHTNVLMTIGAGFALWCPEALLSDDECEEISAGFEADGLENIHLSLDQVRAFAGNMLQVNTPTGPCLLMSQTARDSLSSQQLARLKRRTALQACAIPTIERIGGGGLRCMLAEILLGSEP